jgi:hypothetical protein
VVSRRPSGERPAYPSRAGGRPAESTEWTAPSVLLAAGCVSCLGTTRLASRISEHPSPVVLVGAGLYAIGLRSGEVYGLAQREHAREDAGYFRGHRGDLVYLHRRLTQGQQAVVAQVDRLRRRARAPLVLAQTLPHSMGSGRPGSAYGISSASRPHTTT